jgi:hypothetical protein
MRNPQMKKFILIAFTLVLVGLPVSGAETKSSLEYAKLSKKLLIVMRCTHYSGYISDKAEQKRLGNLAFKIGRDFYSGWKNGKIKEIDWRTTVPMLFALHAGGPSIDFQFGRIWQHVKEKVYDDLGNDLASKGCEDCRWDKKLRTYRMEKYYKDSNCELIE